MNTSVIWAQYLCSQVNSLHLLSFLIHGSRFPSICYIACNLQVVSWVQSIYWCCNTSMSSKWYKSHPPSGTSLSFIHRPMVHTWDRDSVTQVVKWFNLTTEILGSNPTGVHSLVWLPKACWWDLMKVETALQVLAGLVWSFLIQRSRTLTE